MASSKLVLLALALLVGAAFALHPACGALGACLVYAGCAGSQGRVWCVAFAVVIAMQAARVDATAQSRLAARASLLTEHARPSRCDGIGTIRASPVRVGVLRIEADVHELHCDDVETSHARLVRLYVDADALFARGDRIAFIADLAVPEAFANAAVASPLGALGARAPALSGSAQEARVILRGRGPPALIDRARHAVRLRIMQTFTPDTEALGRALMLGETDLGDSESERFRASGLAHLLAVSGVHLSLAVGVTTRVLRRALARISYVAARMDVGRLAALAGIPLAWLYVDFAGGSGSAVRAAVMLSFSYGGTLLSRRTTALRALAASAAFTSAWDPFTLLDVSFTLSLVATLGLVVLGEGLTRAVRSVFRVSAVASSLGSTLAATAMCVPILCALGSSVPLASIPLNLVAVPLGELCALPLCLFHAVSAFAPGLEAWLARASSGALRLVDAVAAIGSRAPGIDLPPPTPLQWTFLLSGFALAVVWWNVRARLAYLSVALFGLLGIAELAARVPPSSLRVTFLDVGQGDSALIETPTGMTIVVDAGGMVGNPTDLGRRVLLPVLREKRIRSVDLVVLSHPHPDHYGGLATGLSQAHVATFWDSGLGAREGVGGAYAQFIGQHRAEGMAMPPFSNVCGAHFIGGVLLEVLAPCPSFDMDQGANDNSIVFRLTYGDRRFLFVGDAEHAEEGALVRSFGARGLLRADVLKVGHHGSRTSSTQAFVGAVRPSTCVVSSGVRNRFGHPHPNTLETLRGSHVLRTDRHGSIVVETDGTSLEITQAM